MGGREVGGREGAMGHKGPRRAAETARHYAAKGRKKRKRKGGTCAQDQDGTRVPRIHAVTFNVNSCSAHAVTTEGEERRRRLVKSLRNVVRHRDFCLLQETKYGEREDADLEDEFPDFRFFRSNLTKGSAGVATMVRKTVFAKFTVEEMELPVAAKGRVLVLEVRPKECRGDAKAGFNLANVYFSSGQGDMVIKEGQIKTLERLAGEHRSVIGGDFNFVESASDCSGDLDNACLTGDAEKEWERIVELLGLGEIGQDAHTRFARGKKPSSSRLDRFYVTSSPAERTMTVVRAYLIPAGGDNGRPKVGLGDRIDQGRTLPLISRISDHLPVGLDHFARPPSTSGDADIPAWVEKIDGFGDAVAKAFGEDRVDISAFVELERWRACVRKVYKKMVQGQKKLGVAHGGQARKLSKAIVLYGLAMRTQPDTDKINGLIKNNPYLTGLVTKGWESENFRYEVDKLQDFIQKMYGEGVRDSVSLSPEELDKMERPAPYLPGSSGGGTTSRTSKPACQMTEGGCRRSDPLQV